MILGIGSDLIDIRLLEKTLERFADHITNRVFTEIERTRSDKHAERAASDAERFAGWKLCSKAPGSHYRIVNARREMEAVNLPSGKPISTMNRDSAERSQAMVLASFWNVQAALYGPLSTGTGLSRHLCLAGRVARATEGGFPPKAQSQGLPLIASASASG